MASTMHSASFSLGTTRTLTSCRPDAGRLVLCCRAVGKKANGILVADAVTLCVAVLLCLAAPAAQAESCRSETFAGGSYVVCSFDPAKENLRMFWRDSNGEPYR